MRPLNPREQRFLAAGLLALALAAVWLAVIRPIADGFADRAGEKQRLALNLQRDARLSAAAPFWRRAAQTQNESAARFAVIAPNEQIAVEAMKDRLNRIAAAEGFNVGAVQDLQANASPGMVRVRADMTMTLAQFVETMKLLESQGAYVVVEYLSVSADRAFAAGKLSAMDVRLELSAAWRPTGARPSGLGRP
jgi:type II secretory pathway component PulM